MPRKTKEQMNNLGAILKNWAESKLDKGHGLPPQQKWQGRVSVGLYGFLYGIAAAASQGAVKKNEIRQVCLVSNSFVEISPL